MEHPNPNKLFVILRPPRFGKSLSMNMLQRFFENVTHDKNESSITQRRLFVGGQILDMDDGERILPALQIAKHKDLVNKHQGQYPVASITFRWTWVISEDLFIESMRITITIMVEKHKYLLDYFNQTNYEGLDEKEKIFLREMYKGDLLTKEEVMSAIGTFVKMLYLYHKKKVILLVDKYDQPIFRAFRDYGADSPQYKGIHKAIVTMLGRALDKKEYIEFTVVSGTMPILFEHCTHDDLFTVLDKSFSPYFGFTAAEVKKLLKGANHTSPAKLKEMRTWYAGYNIAGLEVFNARSSIMCLQYTPTAECYNMWVWDRTLEPLQNLTFKNTPTLQHLRRFIFRNTTVSVDIKKEYDYHKFYDDMNIFPFLVYQGFLTAKPSGKTYKVKAANNECWMTLKETLFYLNISGMPTTIPPSSTKSPFVNEDQEIQDTILDEKFKFM